MRVWWLLGLVLTIGVAACGGGETTSGDDVGRVDAHGDAGPSGDVGVGNDTGADVAEWPPLRTIVIAVISDTHVCGDSEHGLSTQLADMLDTLAQLEPQPEAIAITGDLVDSIPGCGGPDVDPLETFADIVSASPIPVLVVPGNHDYYADDFPQFLLTEDRAARDARYAELLGIEPWYTAVLGGVKLIFLDTMQGPLWDASTGLSGSLGSEQLAWLDTELADGHPAVVFMHHPPSLVDEPDESETFDDVLARHADNVLGILAGHLHFFARAEMHGAPLLLTAAAYQSVANHHHLRVDPVAGTLTVLNEDAIDYDEPNVGECDPETEPSVGDLSVFDDTTHQILILDATGTPAGFGTYLEEGVKMMPVVFHIDGAGAEQRVRSGRLTAGVYEGNSFGGMPPYVDAVPGAECVALDLLADDPCFVAQPVGLTLDIGRALGLPLPPDWVIRAHLNDLQIQGRFSTEPGPRVVDGLLTTEADLSVTVDDLKTVVVKAYCDGDIAACVPGTEGMPTCPGEPTSAFFDSVPVSCDPKVAGFGVRALLAIVEGVPGQRGTITASFVTRSPSESETRQAGAVAPELLSTEAGANCEGL